MALASGGEFYVDTEPVSNARFAKFVEETGHKAGRMICGCWLDPNNNGLAWRPDPGHPEAPAVNLTWLDALAYAKWAGKEIPTEDRWTEARRTPGLWFGERVWELTAGRVKDGSQWPPEHLPVLTGVRTEAKTFMAVIRRGSRRVSYEAIMCGPCCEGCLIVHEMPEPGNIGLRCVHVPKDRNEADARQ